MSRRSTPPGIREVRTVRHPLRARALTVIEVQQLSVGMRRIVLGGEELEAAFPFPALAPGDHVKVFFPDEASGELVLPLVKDDSLKKPESGKLSARRDYTVRHFDAVAKRLSIDFVLHDHGPAGRWAIAAQPGDRVGVVGPRGSHLIPTDYAHYLLIGDETALPAIGRFLDGLASEVRAQVIVLLQHPGNQIDLPAGVGRSITWLPRSATAQDELERLVTESAVDADSYVWAAGESGMLRPLRKWLKNDSGLHRAQWDTDGYWKRGHADVDHHALAAEAEAEED